MRNPHPFALRSAPETVNPSVTTPSLATGRVMSLVAWFRLPRAQQGMALEAAAWLTLARVLVVSLP